MITSGQMHTSAHQCTAALIELVLCGAPPLQTAAASMSEERAAVIMADNCTCCGPGTPAQMQWGLGKTACAEYRRRALQSHQRTAIPLPMGRCPCCLESIGQMLLTRMPDCCVMVTNKRAKLQD